MKKKKITKSLIMTAIFLIVPIILSNQTILAGDSGCQSGTLAHKYNNYSRQTTAERQEQFQAAQIRNGENKPPTAGNLIEGGSETRNSGTYFASVFFLLGGLWLLFSLLRERFLKRYAPKSARRAKVWNFALKPSFALSAFVFLFAAVVAGSFLTSPTITSAQKRSQNSPLNDKANSVNLGLPTNVPVFKEAQAIGGDGVTQIGTPVYDVLGNYYVRGTFSGTMTLGETTLTATQGLDLFFAKYDDGGNLIWARQGNGINNAPSEDISVEGVTAMALRGSDLYVAGSFVKSLTLQGGANPDVMLSDNGAPGYNYETFFAKYDTDGNLIWAKGGNSNSPKNLDNLETGQNTINKILFDRNNFPYLAGIISGNNFLGTPIANFVCNTNQPCAIQGKSDVLLAVINPYSGDLEGLKIIGGAGDDNALDMAVDNITDSVNPRFYLVGNSDSPQINFLANGGGGGTYNNADGTISTFIIQFQPFNLINAVDGAWVKFLDNNNLVGINQIVTDPVSGTPFVTGYYKGTLTAQDSSTLINTRTGTDETALAGYVAIVSQIDGSFGKLAGLGGVGNAMVIKPGGNIFIVGSLWDTGTFTSFGPFGQTVHTLESLGGNDLFVAELNKFTFDFSSLKAVAGTGYQGLVAAGNPSTADGGTKNSYSPLGIALDNTGHITISGDFAGALSLDCITLKTEGASRHAYIAKILGGNESSSCRVWTNGNPNNRTWNETDNWNGGIIPQTFDSVYVPYHREALFDPIYDPVNNVALNGLSISDNQTLVLQQNLTVSERLDLLGGRIDAGSNLLDLGPFVESYSTDGGRVLGKVQKLFFGSGASFTFPVGTENGYSPLTLSNVSAGKGATFAVTAHEGTYPNTANNLPMTRAARWWNLTNGGLISANLTFQYLPGDITAGTESGYRTYRIPSGGGTASLVESTINTTTKTVFVPNVSQFSDWTFAQPLAPTAARVIVGGRVLTANGQGISQTRVTITDSTGNSRTVLTNSFGYYTFSQVTAGDTYVLAATHKRYIFSQSTQVVSVSEDRHDIDFVETP